MIYDTPAAPASESARPGEFYLARQPILDRSQSLVAYELLFRSANKTVADVTDDLEATASVIANLSELGVDQVIGGLQGFVNVDAAALMSDFIGFLAPKQTVLEILETVKGTPDLVARLTELAAVGYVFALDDVVAETADVRMLMPLVKIIKIDLTGLSAGDLLRLSTRFRQAGKALLAEKVETREQFEQCLVLGFDYFQGYYFAKPVVLSGKKLTPSQLVLVDLMSLIMSDADNAEIERCIKRDAALSLTLLQLVNTAGSGSVQRINSLSQAVIVLGRRNLQRWLQILLYAGPSHSGKHISPLMVMAATRGRLLELVAEKVKAGDRAAADVAFTVGIMSLIDALLGVPMEEIVMKISVHDDVMQALLHREGFYGDLLKLAESLERFEEESLPLKQLADRLGLSSADLNALQLNAFEWSGMLANAAW